MELNFLFVRRYGENREISMHSHVVYEFVYYFDGEGTSTINQQEHRFDHDSYAVIAPQVMHDERHIGRGHIFAVGFSIEDESLALESEMYNGFDPNIYALVQKIKTEWVRKDDFYQHVITSLLTELVLYLKRKQLDASSTKSRQNNDISFAISYLNEYFMTDIDFDDLAQSAGYCKDHFRILFKKETGMTPKSFVLSKKLSYAKHLLIEQDIPLVTVASQCGFDYYSCFCSFIKKETGMTPLNYRKNAQP